jgi:hypothetical protein
MATITITIPDAYTAEVADAFDVTYGPRPQGMTKEVFVTQQCRLFIKHAVEDYRRRQKATEAQASIAKVDADWKT